jgi:hypothetical protein
VSLDEGQCVVNDVLAGVDCVRVMPFWIKALAYRRGPCIHSEILFIKLTNPVSISMTDTASVAATVAETVPLRDFVTASLFTLVICILYSHLLSCHDI